MLLTFSDDTKHECLTNILDSYAALGENARTAHAELLACSIHIPTNDARAKERVEQWMATYDERDEAEEQRGFDLVTLAAMERGDAPPERAL